VDILTKKKAAPKSSKVAAAKEGSLDSEAGAGGDRKPGQAKGRKVTKRQPSSLDSDSDFGAKPSKSVAAKVCVLPPAEPRGYRRARGRLFGWEQHGRGGTSSAPAVVVGGREGRVGHTCLSRVIGLVSPTSRLARDAVACSRFKLGFMIRFVILLPLQKSKLEDDESFTVDSTARADSPVAAVPRARPGRLKKPVQYLEESDEDDMF